MPLTDPFKQNFKTYLIHQLFGKFSYNNGDSWLLGIGKPTAWANESVPPRNLDSLTAGIEFWQNAMAFKSILKSDVSLVVRRVDWTSGVIYDSYRDNIDLFDDRDPANFYVLVEESRVYKCIDNNDGAFSTVAPTHTDSTIRKTSDGYRWKFLYRISENSRKFLSREWMPVEYVEFLESSLDDRSSQYDVQNAAVDGSIDFIDLISPGITFYGAIPATSSNQIASGASAGATSARLGGPYIGTSNGIHDGYVLKIESGPGEGQQRVIDSYVYQSNVGIASFTQPLNVTLQNNGGTAISRYSIVPQVRIRGNGTVNSNTLNSYITTMEAAAKIDDDRRLTSIEIIDAGKNYTYATVDVLPAAGQATARAIISPKGGHGSNAVAELGAAAIMIATDFTQDESETVSVQNQYRQFAVIQNPITRHKRTYLRLQGTGQTNTFAVGYTANQTGANYYGMTGWIAEYSYSTSVSGNCEIVVRDYSGTGASSHWQQGATFSSGSVSRRILEVEERTTAGREGRVFYRMQIEPPSGVTSFSVSVPAFTKGSLALGRGITSTAIEPETRKFGRILDFQLNPGILTRGSLLVENLPSSLTAGEAIWQTEYDYSGITGPKAVVSFVTEGVSGMSAVYDNTWRMTIGWDGVNYFTSDFFDSDSQVYGFTGASATTSYGRGILVDFTSLSGATQARIRVLQQGESGFSAGHYFSTNADTGDGTVLPIIEVLNEPDLVLYSGEVVYIQNIKPIERDEEQKEEIKLIIKL